MQSSLDQIDVPQSEFINTFSIQNKRRKSELNSQKTQGMHQAKYILSKNNANLVPQNNIRASRFCFKDFINQDSLHKATLEHQRPQQNHKHQISLNSLVKKDYLALKKLKKNKQFIDQKLFYNGNLTISQIISDYQEKSFQVRKSLQKSRTLKKRQKRDIFNKFQQNQRILSRSFRKKPIQFYFQNEQKQKSSSPVKQSYDQFGFLSDPVLLQFLGTKSMDRQEDLCLQAVSNLQISLPGRIYSSITIQQNQRQEAQKPFETSHSNDKQVLYSKSLFSSTQITRSKSNSLLGKVKSLLGMDFKSGNLKRTQSLDKLQKKQKSVQTSSGIFRYVKGFISKFMQKQTQKQADQQISQYNLDLKSRSH